MGAIQSVVVSLLPVGNAPTEGPYEMQSDECLKWLSDKRTFGENGGHSGDPKPYAKIKDYYGTSNRVKDTFALGASNPAVIKYCHGDLALANCSDLDGANVNVDDGCLHVVVGLATGVQAPAGVWSSDMDVFALEPVVRAVDLYLYVDGAPMTDGHVCLGDASFSKAQAIDVINNYNTIKLYGNGQQAALKTLLESGPSDGSKPWATIVGDKFAQENFLHLPLMHTNIDAALVGESEAYGHSLITKFSAALKKAGAGAHEFKLTVRPRGMMDISNIGDDDGNQILGTTGLYNKGPSEVASRDSGFKAHLAKFPAQVLTAVNAPGLTATFTMGVGADAGNAPLRKAFDFAGDWPRGELQECIEIARSLAGKGPCGSKTAQMGVGKLAHIILVGGISDMVGIQDHSAENGTTEYDDFACFALFKSKDAGDANALGAQIHFRCKRITLKNDRPVSDPQWESAGFGMHGTEIQRAQTITNGEIDAAIKRDAKFYAW